MGFFEAFIKALIFICLLAGVYFLTGWVLAGIGLAIPMMLMHIFGIILVLIAILVLVRLFYPFVSGYTFFPPRSPPNPPPPHR